MPKIEPRITHPSLIDKFLGIQGECSKSCGHYLERESNFAHKTVNYSNLVKDRFLKLKNQWSKIVQSINL